MPDPWLYLHGLCADREALEKKTKEEQSVRQRAKRLLLTGLMVCASGSFVGACTGSDDQGSQRDMERGVTGY